MAAKSKVDYSQIDDDWKAGIKSVKQIAAEYTARNEGVSISDKAISKHYEKLNIKRSLASQIVEQAQSMVHAAMVTGKVTVEPSITQKDSEIISVNAKIVANSLLSHRSDITRYRELTLKLLREIEVETDNTVAFEELADMIIWKSGADGDVETKDEIKRKMQLQALFDRVMSNPSRVDSIKKLVDTLKTLIGLERQSLGIKDDDKPPGGDEERITRIERVIIKERITMEKVTT